MEKSRIKELEIAGNVVSNQKEMIESFASDEVLEKSELLEPLKCSKKGNAEENNSVKKSKRKQSLQENKNESEESKRERKFRCDVCKIFFVYKHALKRHISTVHERQKPFKCELCDHTSGVKQSLDRHMNSVHEKNIFSCTKCNKGFTRKDERNKHEGKCKHNILKKHLISKIEKRNSTKKI